MWSKRTSTYAASLFASRNRSSSPTFANSASWLPSNCTPKRSSIENIRLICPSESQPGTSAAVVASVSTIDSSTKTSRKTRSSSSCTGTERLLLACDVYIGFVHGRLGDQVVGPFRRLLPLPPLLESEPREQVADEPVLGRR